jgi:hypothetical protein
LISLVFLFRALKQPHRTWTAILLVAFVGAAIAGKFLDLALTPFIP